MSTVLRGERVTLRQWIDADLAPFAAMNADDKVMRHLISKLTREESDAFVQRVRNHIDAHGYGLWALDVPDIGFAGFVGLSSRVPFDLPLPGVLPQPHEIGWRLAPAAWGHGYASEAAALVKRYAFDVIGLPQIVSFTAASNTASQAVMKRIGLTLLGEFDHPRLDVGHRLRKHLLFHSLSTQDDSSPTTLPRKASPHAQAHESRSS
jgi:RimJ/RimL family protein N-acetyltransferase